MERKVVVFKIERTVAFFEALFHFIEHRFRFPPLKPACKCLVHRAERAPVRTSPCRGNKAKRPFSDRVPLKVQIGKIGNRELCKVVISSGRVQEHPAVFLESEPCDGFPEAAGAKSADKRDERLFRLSGDDEIHVRVGKHRLRAGRHMGPSHDDRDIDPLFDLPRTGGRLPVIRGKKRRYAHQIRSFSRHFRGNLCKGRAKVHVAVKCGKRACIGKCEIFLQVGKVRGQWHLALSPPVMKIDHLDVHIRKRAADHRLEHAKTQRLEPDFRVVKVLDGGLKEDDLHRRQYRVVGHRMQTLFSPISHKGQAQVDPQVEPGAAGFPHPVLLARCHSKS